MVWGQAECGKYGMETGWVWGDMEWRQAGCGVVWNGDRLGMGWYGMETGWV